MRFLVWVAPLLALGGPLQENGPQYVSPSGKARKYFERALATDAWTSLGYIASELDLARLP